MTHKVLVSDKISEDGIAVFEKAGFQVDHLPEITQDQIRECIGEYSAWVIRSRSRATAEIIERADKLRVIGRAGAGVDNVDTPAATRKGIIVMNTPGGNTLSTAEHTVSMMLSLARKIPNAVASMRRGEWDKKSFMGVEMSGKTLGILGLGRIGQEVAKRLRAFDMHILGYDPFLPHERMRQLGVEPCSVDEICKRADFITVHTPLSAETRDMIGKAQFDMMKKTARVVNCARGGIINEDALLEALQNKKIAGAAFDVFASEPLPDDHPFRTLESAVVTPHIAASTTEAQENVAIQVAEQIVDLLKGGNVRNAVNAPSVDPELLPILGPYMEIGRKLGCFASQYRRSRAVKLNVTYSGSVKDYPVAPITTSVIQGFLEKLSDLPINAVNAHQILKDRGVDLVEAKHSETFQYTNLIMVEVENEDGTRNHVAGTLFTPSHPRIVVLNDKHVAAVPEGNLIVIENEDVPGIIGAVGTVFGKNQINIGQLTWGRKPDDNLAMTIINLDTAVPETLLKQLREVPHIRSVDPIVL